jgi:ribosomal protein S18 acetylase RimI-like enzyme
MDKIEIAPVQDKDRKWMTGLIKARWGEERVVTHGFAFRPPELPGFIAYQGQEKVGLLTYNIDHDSCEIITIDSLRPRREIGSKLIEEMKRFCQRSGCDRLWVITTNDNLDALRFLQKRGFVLVALHKNALEVSRVMKPIIPTIGREGIPLRDEIELEWLQSS